MARARPKYGILNGAPPPAPATAERSLTQILFHIRILHSSVTKKYPFRKAMQL